MWRPEDYGRTRRDYRLLGAALREKPAGELVDLQHAGPDIVVGYRVPDGVVQALLRFDDVGKIERSRCGPLSGDPA